MFQNRFLVVTGVISFLLVTLAVSSPRSHASATANLIPSDLYQQQPERWWLNTKRNVGVPLTVIIDDAITDYYQRHPELTVPSLIGQGASDYFQRHPELTAPAEAALDTTDYYFRHLELQGLSISDRDMTDYFFRHLSH
jgi:hypothetical protein